MKNQKKSKKPNKKKKHVAKSIAVVPKLKGKGFYSGFSSDVGGMLGSGIGGLFGNSGIGKTIGSGLGSIFSKITGFGSYRVNQNTLMSDSGPPVFANGAEGSVIISRREFIGDLKGSIAFRNNVFQLNPSNPTLFPWLSTQTKGFEQYQILGMIIEYRPTSGNAVSSSNNAMGTVIMATNYDVVDPPFTTKQEMENYQYTVSTIPSAQAIHPIECKPKLNVLDNMYIRQLSSPASADPRFYDLGAVQIATIGMQADDITIGEIWISYHIKLIKPKFPDSNAIGFYAPPASNLLTAATTLLDNSTTPPTETPYCSVPYTATTGTDTGSITVKLNLPGNYYYYSWAPVSSSGTVNTSYTFDAVTSVNAVKVAFGPSFLGGSNTYTSIKATTNSPGPDTNNGQTWINSSSGSGFSDGSTIAGSFNVRRGGASVVFNCNVVSTAAAGLGHLLVIYYQGFFDRTIGLATYVPAYSDPNTSLNLALSRIGQLETRLRQSEEKENDQDTFVNKDTVYVQSSSNSQTSSNASSSMMSPLRKIYLK